MKNILIGILLLTLNSCHWSDKGNGIECTIENKSNFPLENVRFTTSENLAELNFDNIEPNKKASDFLTMKDDKMDGSYVLEFTRNGQKETHDYGYYTNGGTLDKRVAFKIENDTVIVKFSGRKY